jgi:predicted ester cyclase
MEVLGIRAVFAAFATMGERHSRGERGGERRGMSTEENKATVRRLQEESLGGGKPELVDELLDPDFVRYDPYIEAGEVRGTQTVKDNIVWFRNAFPDLTCTVEEQVAEGDKVVSRWTLGGTHRGDFFGVDGTGNRVEFTGIQIDRFDESGKIVEERAEFDLLGAMRQVGAIPEPGQ